MKTVLLNNSGLMTGNVAVLSTTSVALISKKMLPIRISTGQDSNIKQKHRLNFSSY